MMQRITLTLPSPYVGLRPFEEDDALLFFGRDGHVDELVAKLEDTRFVAVVGESGSGKSSLVRAGLIPALHRGALPRTARGWNVYMMRPGDSPLLNLARELARDERWLGGMDQANGAQYLRSLMASSPLGLGQLFASLQQQFANEACAIVVDQFEEIFRYRQLSIDEAEAFIKLLLRTAAAPERQLHVVITMRADFLGNCMAFHGLPEAINSGLYLTPRLTREQLLSVIVSPLSLVGGTIDPALANHLVNNLTRDDELPVLQHKLLRMWDHAKAQSRTQLEFADFEAVSRRATATAEHQAEAAEPAATNAIDIHASEIYDRLPSDSHRSVAQQLFVLLTDRRDGRDVRHPRALTELAQLVGADHRAELTTVIEAYREHGVGFLVPPAGTALTDQAVIDISHESLIRQWESLQRWLAEEEADASGLQEWQQRTQRHLARTGDLLNVADSARAESWLERLANKQRGGSWASRYLSATDPSFEQIQHFIRGSRAELERRRRNRRYVGGAVVVVALLVAVGFAWLFARAQSTLNQVQAFVDADKFDRLRKDCPLLLTSQILTDGQLKKEDLVERCTQALPEVAKLKGGLDQHKRTEQELAAKVETKGGTQHITVSQLIRDLETLQFLPAVANPDEARAVLEKLRRAYDGSKWQKAIAAVAQSQNYKGLKLTPKFDLVPLGEDPDSGLAEFAHVRSGAVAERDPKGRLIVTAETGVVLVLIPGGSFVMGSKGAEPPAHKVTVRPFLMAKRELTQGQLARLTGKQSTGDGLRPAVNFSFDDAKQLSASLGLRVPTEAEWEYGARSGGKDERWAGTSDEKQLPEYAVFGQSAAENVGSKKPNGIGLHDMSGNVWEWVEDCWHDNYNGAPTDGRAWKEENGGHCGRRVIRGGGWGEGPVNLRASVRVWLDADFRGNGVGFRLAQDFP